MTITDKLRPYIRRAAQNIAGGEVVGLCKLSYDMLAHTPAYTAMRTAIAYSIQYPTDAWGRRPIGYRSSGAVKNLPLPPDVAAAYQPDSAWHRVPYEGRVSGALCWYRWAIRACQLADRILKENANGDSLQQ